MITSSDFSNKQIIVVLFRDGEKMAIRNSNLTVCNPDGTIKLQCTCYRIFLILAVGHCTLTSAVLQSAKRFGFFIALMTPGFRLYDLVGAKKDSNYLLHKKQYAYDGISLAKHITENKIHNQIAELKKNRFPNESIKEAIYLMENYTQKLREADALPEILAYEGLSSKIYFRNHFNNVPWIGRQPRIKRDYVNAALDVGYTVLFSFIDALLSAFGFDTYCGVMHKQFYMRKSLVCDLVEPFRPLIDHVLKSGINLKQVQQDHFKCINGQWQLKWEFSPKYIKLFMEPLLKNREAIFTYIQGYYRAFMKELPPAQFPVFEG